MSAQTARATPQQLATLTPLAGLSLERLDELAQVAVLERAARGSDPLLDRTKAAQSIFLLQGELLLAYEGGGTLVVVGGSEETRQALNRQKPRVGRSKAITDVDLLSVDDDVLDILATWDQVAGGSAEGSVMGRAVRSDARLITGAFSLSTLRSGAFAQLPAAHIDELLTRFERIKPSRGDLILAGAVVVQTVMEVGGFAGLEVTEVAEVLQISPATVKRDWQFARAWLARELRAESAE